MADQEPEVSSDGAGATGGGNANYDRLELSESTRDTMLQHQDEILQRTSPHSKSASGEKCTDEVTSPREDGKSNRDVAEEDRTEEAAHGDEASIARADRTRQIELEVANQEAVLDRLRKKHEGKPGRWNWRDTEMKYTVNNNLKLLAAGILPSEQSASLGTPHPMGSGAQNLCASERAGQMVWSLPQSRGGGANAAGLGTPTSSWQSTGYPAEKCAAMGGGETGVSQEPHDKGLEGEVSDVTDSAGEEDDKLAREAERSSIPQIARKRLAEVLRQSKNGRLSDAGSCVFYPNDPAKYSLCSTFHDPNAPVVYVEAPHVYHGRRGIPTQPPCPKHGWEAVQNGQVEAMGWTDGRRVLGILEDGFLVGTKHVCRLCRQGLSEQEHAKRAKRCDGGGQGDEGKGHGEDEEPASRTYTFRSYDPGVMKLYRQRYPWIAEQVIVCTRSVAMTRELHLLLKRSVASGAKPHEVTAMLKKLREVSPSTDEAVRFVFEQQHGTAGEQPTPQKQGGQQDPGRRYKRGRTGSMPSGPRGGVRASSNQVDLPACKRSASDGITSQSEGPSAPIASPLLPPHLPPPREPFADMASAISAVGAFVPAGELRTPPEIASSVEPPHGLLPSRGISDEHGSEGVGPLLRLGETGPSQDGSMTGASHGTVSTASFSPLQSPRDLGDGDGLAAAATLAAFPGVRDPTTHEAPASSAASTPAPPVAVTTPCT